MSDAGNTCMFTEEVIRNLDTDKLIDLLAALNTAPKAMTTWGRDGKVIGIVCEPEDKKNLVVLFSTPPEAAKKVLLLEYDTRQSQKGKTYLKAFLWVEEEKADELREALKREIKNRVLSAFPEEHRDLIDKVLAGEVPEEIAKVDFIAVGGSIEERDMYVALAADGFLYEVELGYSPRDIKILTRKPVLKLESEEIIRVSGVYMYKLPYFTVLVPKTESASKAIKALLRLRKLHDLPPDIRARVEEKIIQLSEKVVA